MSSPASRAQEATELLEHPAFQRVLEESRAQYIHEFEMSRTSDERDALHAKIRALSDLKSRLQADVTNGKLADRVIRTRI